MDEEEEIRVGGRREGKEGKRKEEGVRRKKEESNYMVPFTFTYPVQCLYGQVKGYHNYHADVDYKTKLCYAHVSSGVVELQGEEGRPHHV